MITQLLYFVQSFVMATGPVPPAPRQSGDSPSNAAIVTLVCAILSWTFLPIVAGVVGIIVGRGELKAIEQGRSPASGEILTKVGYWICVANVALTIFSGCVTVAIFVAIWGGLLSLGGLAAAFGG